jgi:trigger factor
MKLEMTELGPMKRALKIEVPEENVNKEFDKVYADLKRKVRIPGFRQGKAPLSMLEQRYGKEVEQDVVQRLVPDYYQQAIKEAGVTPVMVDIPPLERIKVKRNSVFSFTATVEIKPQIELHDYRPPNPISLKPDPRSVTEEQVTEALESFRQKQARLEGAPEGTPLADNFYAVVKVEGKLDGTPLEGASKEGHLHQIGSKSPILGLDLEEALLGKKEGDTFELSQEYSSSHPDERLAGKSVEFSITVQGVKQKNLPELDDEFAKDCGPFETLEQLKDTIRTELETLLKKDIEEAHKEHIMERLLTMHHFDIPEVLVDREVRTMVRQRLIEDQQKKKGGNPLDDHLQQEQDIKRLQEEFLPDAKKRVKLSLILEAISQKEAIEVEEQDIQDEITKLAKGLKLPVEDVQRMVASGGEESLSEFRERIRAEKALQLVYQFAVIQG